MLSGVCAQFSLCLLFRRGDCIISHVNGGLDWGLYGNETVRKDPAGTIQ